jgi:Tol biopolymer transport system component
LRIHHIATGQDTALVAGLQPAWSPDGERILFLSENRSVQVIRPDGSDLQTLVLRPEYPGLAAPPLTHRRPLWSPDSQHVLYSRQALVSLEIHCIPARGGDPINLTRDIGWAMAGAWRTDPGSTLSQE